MYLPQMFVKMYVKSRKIIRTYNLKGVDSVRLIDRGCNQGSSGVLLDLFSRVNRSGLITITKRVDQSLKSVGTVLNFSLYFTLKFYQPTKLYKFYFCFLLLQSQDYLLQAFQLLMFFL